ncbi:MAG: hypothetical protein NT010_04595 [Proteobacteria bacterium]|nr:hypothetical protein [Pseudomonadota bacterium]
MEMKIEKLTPFFISDSHKRICESGLSGRLHGSNVSDVDEMQALQAVGVLNVRRRIARYSRSPQMDIAAMQSPDQVEKADNKTSKSRTIKHKLLTIQTQPRRG